MKRMVKMLAVATIALGLTACGGGNANIRADAARVNLMGQSLKTMSKNLSNDEDVSACTVTHTETGWLAGMFTSTESFTSSCEKDPYGEYYDGNAS